MVSDEVPEKSNDDDLTEDDGSPTVSTIYVDFVTSANRSGEVYKLVFGRAETLQRFRQGSVFRNCLQLNMPVEGFLDMHAFLHVQLEKLIEEKVVSRDDFEALISEKSGRHE